MINDVPHSNLYTRIRASAHGVGVFAIRDIPAGTALFRGDVGVIVRVPRTTVEKIADPEDGRGAIVLLTDAGYDAYRRVAVQHAESIRRRVGSVLDSDEMTHLAQLCDKLQAAE